MTDTDTDTTAGADPRAGADAAAAIDAYLAAQPPAQRAALQHLRETIAASAPEAVEAISYDMPAFRYKGRFLVSYAGWKRHCSLYPLTDSLRARFPEAFERLDADKGTIRFRPEEGVPDELVRALVEERVAELDGEAR